METPLSNGTGREPKLVPAGLQASSDRDLAWLRDGLFALSSQLDTAREELVQLASSRAAEQLTDTGKPAFDHHLEEAQEMLVAASISVRDAYNQVS